MPLSTSGATNKKNIKLLTFLWMETRIRSGPIPPSAHHPVRGAVPWTDELRAPCQTPQSPAVAIVPQGVGHSFTSADLGRTRGEQVQLGDWARPLPDARTSADSDLRELPLESHGSYSCLSVSRCLASEPIQLGNTFHFLPSPCLFQAFIVSVGAHCATQLIACSEFFMFQSVFIH